MVEKPVDATARLSEQQDKRTAKDKIAAMPGYLNGYDEVTEADQHHAYIVGFADARWKPAAESSPLLARQETTDEVMATARRWHMAFNSAKKSMTGETQAACGGPDCEFCSFAASVMTRQRHGHSGLGDLADEIGPPSPSQGDEKGEQ